MKKIQAWFPTFIYQASLPGGAPGLRSLHEDCLKLRDKDLAGQKWSAKHYQGGYTSYGSQDKLHRSFSTFTDLRIKIDRHVRAFARHLQWDLEDRALHMTDCWVNVMKKNVVHGLHLHPQSVISGTVYVKTPRGCSRLRFEDPRMDKFMAAPPRRSDCRPENQQQVSYEIRGGDVLLFESWLRHEVSPNPTEAERISVSFNYNWT